MNEKIWGGRFRDNIDAMMDRFNRSIDFDQRLYAQDIEGSMAHCRMLAKQNIITEDEAVRITEALGEIKRSMDRGEISLDDHEDIHTLVEKCLVDKIGPLGEKLHTGRSRNDQIALDTRLYVKEAVNRLKDLIGDMQKTLIGLAEANIDIIMPGYTHLQRAQPVLLAHHLLAYFEMFKRDAERFQDSLKRIDTLPLGSAALAGTSFPVDRAYTAELLGFDAVAENSLDAVSDRDFAVEFCAAGALVMMHLSRFSEELVLWNSPQFGFIELGDAYCTGSSIMPQKKNPDIPELVRGKTGRVYGNLTALLTLMKGQPLAYNRDNQEDKLSLFDTVDTVKSCLTAYTGLVQAVSVNREAMLAAAGRGYTTATDLADYLVRSDVAFRDAHTVVGKVVQYAQDNGRDIAELSLEELRQFSDSIQEDVFEYLTLQGSVNARDHVGGTAPARVAQAAEEARRYLQELEKNLPEL